MGDQIGMCILGVVFTSIGIICFVFAISLSIGKFKENVVNQANSLVLNEVNRLKPVFKISTDDLLEVLYTGKNQYLMRTLRSNELAVEKLHSSSKNIQKE